MNSHSKPMSTAAVRNKPTVMIQSCFVGASLPITRLATRAQGREVK